MQLVAPNNPILHRVCRPDFSLSLDDISQMFFLLREKDGLALAAPQVGIDARLFVTKWNEVFVNPMPQYLGDGFYVPERCLNLPNEIATCRRYPAVRLADGRLFEGEQAIILQHEIDHLDGILITDEG